MTDADAIPNLRTGPLGRSDACDLEAWMNHSANEWIDADLDSPATPLAI